MPLVQLVFQELLHVPHGGEGAQIKKKLVVNRLHSKTHRAHSQEVLNIRPLFLYRLKTHEFNRTHAGN